MSTAADSTVPTGTFIGHPRGLATLFNVELWERFSYYGMRAILLYYIVDTAAHDGLGIEESVGEAIVAIYGATVYLLSIVGGWLADRVVGAQRSVLYGGLVIMSGHISLATPVAGSAWLGIALVALGTGLLKPNVSTMVGHLYQEQDARRDSGFTIFYMAINIGALASPLVVGLLRSTWGYHAGFAAAAVGMAIALVLYYVGRGSLAGESLRVPNPLSELERRLLPVRVVGVLVAVAVLVLASRSWRETSFDAVMDAISILSAGGSIVYFAVMFLSDKVSARERRHLTAYIPLWLAAMLFWMIFEQAANKMASFAQERTDLNSMGLTFQPEWFQSINPLAIIILAPAFSWVWIRRAGRFPNTPVKFALGVGIVGLSFVFLGTMSNAYPGASAPIWVLGSVFVIQTVAELHLSPVGLSATTVLAPKAFASQAMTLWFLASATGQSVAAQAIRATEDIADGTFFMVLGSGALAFGVFLALISRWLHERMRDAEPHHGAADAVA
ncbi:MAG: MFS transporter [Micrococcales bacterium]|nr:MAG: MFS transporter [Micrococcales bacterium]PIE25995.1 MAG: MFS transporter [Micrococcales bacterium]